jgi:hypothetical protein
LKSKGDTPLLLSIAFLGSGFSSKPRQNRRAKAFHPVVPDVLESRTMPSLPVLSFPPDPQGPAGAPPQYYAQAIPISDPSGIVSTNPIWDDALAFQYGPFPDQQLWVFVPPNPNGRLELIVHSGGFRHGAPTSTEIDGFAQLLALINYSASYPTTIVRPNRIITISAPLEANASSPAESAAGFRYPSALRWDGVTPKATIPITLMGTPGDPIAIESHQVSTIHEFASYLRRHGVRVATYFDPHGHGRHGSVASDFLVYPDVRAALLRAGVFL